MRNSRHHPRLRLISHLLSCPGFLPGANWFLQETNLKVNQASRGDIKTINILGVSRKYFEIQHGKYFLQSHFHFQHAHRSGYIKIQQILVKYKILEILGISDISRDIPAPRQESNSEFLLFQPLSTDDMQKLLKISGEEILLMIESHLNYVSW